MPVKPASTRSVVAIAIAIAVLALACAGAAVKTFAPLKSEIPAAPKSPYGSCIMRGMGNQSWEFTERVKGKMRNPGSFVHVKSEVGQVEDGVFPITMKYRATNGFGAVDTYIASGEVRVSDCAVKVISL